MCLSAVDDLLRHSDDKPTIGPLLCRSGDKMVVEYARRDLKEPIGVAGWATRIVEELPESIKGSLPTVEEIEAEFGGEGGLDEPVHHDEQRVSGPHGGSGCRRKRQLGRASI